MKKTLILILVLSSFSWLFSACNDNGESVAAKKTGSQNSSLENPLNPDKNEKTTEMPDKELKSEYGKPEADRAVDIDLTKLSSTMVYAEVNSIMMNPEKYLGKSIKIHGEYYARFYDPMQKFYHFVIIFDALACCEQGLEFNMAGGNYAYPDDYPPDATMVEIVGVFESYEEEGETWHRVRTEGIKIL